MLRQAMTVLMTGDRRLVAKISLIDKALDKTDACKA
jgi:hypothetical protein